MKLIAAGNLTEGFQFHGPFSDSDNIDAYGERYTSYAPNSVVTLRTPEGPEYETPADATIARLRAALADIHACATGSAALPAARVSYVETMAHAALKHAEPACEIVIVGGPDGMKFYGPFQDEQLAQAWADRVHGDDTWWTVTAIRQKD